MGVSPEGIARLRCGVQGKKGSSRSSVVCIGLVTGILAWD